MLEQALKAANDAGEEGAPSLAHKPNHIVLVGNFPPRRCGIATFTRDTYEALTGADRRLRCDVVAITDGAVSYKYPREVAHEIRQNRIADYARVAKALAAEQPDVLCLQHEFGIFGGEAGDHVLTLLYGLACPVVTILHTVLHDLDAAQRRVMAALIARSSRLIVMAEKGRQILIEDYDVPEANIVVVPHGAPDHPFVDSAAFKAPLGLAGREVLLTFGLLSPNKGIEAAIRALPAIRAARPHALYVVLGATHPHLLAREGESYRENLQTLAESLGVGGAVRFVNAYVDNETLLNYLAAADIYLTPYLNKTQITSGTLSYAVALGKPVISTPYWHARELLSDGVGVLVGFNDPAAIAASAVRLLSDPERRMRVRRAAYRAGRDMIWSRVGERYLAEFAEAKARPPARSWQRFALPQPSLAGLAQMSDDCGVYQHSSYGVADRRHGYCVDDNARALMVMNRFEAMGRAANAGRLTEAYAAFVNHAWNPSVGRFRNFMSYDRRWLEEEGSEDSFGRAFQALGDTAERSARADLRYWAQALARDVLAHTEEIGALRARAFIVFGLLGLLAAAPGMGAVQERLERQGEHLMARLALNRQPGWTWFERCIAYDNARLPEALLRAGLNLKNSAMIEAGLETLRWLCALQSSPSGRFRAIGSSGIGARVVVAPPFDQQPLEAAATVDACAAAFAASGDQGWVREAQRAFDWFLGSNDMGACVADPERGLCYDGVTPERLNLNHGAESIVSFQLAVCAMHALSRASRTASVRAVRT